MRKLQLISFVFACIWLTACNRLSPGEYLSWIQNESNVLRIRQLSNGYIFDLQYLPSDWLDFQKQQQGQAVDALEGEKMHYFKLTLQRQNPDEDIIKFDCRSKEAQDGKIYHLSYQFKDLIKSNNQSPLLYHYERSYGAKSLRNIMFSIPKGFNEEQVLVSISPGQISKDSLMFDFSLVGLPELIID